MRNMRSFAARFRLLLLVAFFNPFGIICSRLYRSQAETQPPQLVFAYISDDVDGPRQLAVICSFQAVFACISVVVTYCSDIFGIT